MLRIFLPMQRSRTLFLVACLVALAASSIGLPVLLPAQINLDGNNYPAAGEQYLLSATNNTLFIDLGQTGANQSWDFSSLTPTRQFTLNYESGINSPYAGNPLLLPILLSRFGRPVADLPDFVNDLLEDNVGFRLENQYLFYDNSKANGLIGSARGAEIAGIPVALPYEDEELVLPAPLAYNQQVTDSFAYQIGIPEELDFEGTPSIFVRGERTTTADGWGTLTLPEGTYQCLRVRSVIPQVFDLSELVGFELEIPFTLVEIRWLTDTPGEHHPVALVNGFELAGQTIYTEIQYRDIDRRPQPAFALTTADEGCRPFGVSFSNSTTDADAYSWNFGDGNTSTSAAPNHTYTTPGLYTVELTASNTFGQRTVVEENLVRVGGPTAEFSASPTQQPAPSLPVDFLDESAPGYGNLSYTWQFGDGFFSTSSAPLHFYSSTGQYDVQLITTDALGCRDTSLRPAYITIGNVGRPNTLPEPAGALRCSYQRSLGAITLHGLATPTQTPGSKLPHFRLLNLQGRPVARWHQRLPTTDPPQLKLPQPLPTGVYLLRSTLGTCKVVVE